MSDLKDFLIENGVLKEYVGEGGDVIVPDGVTCIGESVFSVAVAVLGKNITSVSVPASVVIISDWAFSGCETLKCVNISEGLQSIGEEAFAGCKNIKDITIPRGVKSIGDSAFLECDSLSDVTILDSETKIGVGAFCDCKNLSTISFPSNYKIGAGLFGAGTCKKAAIGLAPLYNQMSDTAVRDYILDAGQYGRSLNIWKELDSDLQYDIFMARQAKPLLQLYKKRIKDPISFGQSIIARLPKTLSSKECKAITNFILLFAKKDNAEIMRQLYAILSKQKNATKYLEMIEESAPTMIPLEIQTKQGKKIKTNSKLSSDNNDKSTLAFTYTVSKNKTVKLNTYVSLEGNVNIPASIEGCPVVGFNKDLFRNNQNITSVVWPAEIPVIPKEMFFGCSNLKEVVLQDGVTEISEKAFRNCEALETVSIPNSVTAIHEKAFECAKMDSTKGWQYWNGVGIIKGNVGSYASVFAKENGIRFAAFGVSAEEMEALNKYSYHEVEDGISLDDYVLSADMVTVETAYSAPYLVNFEIPNEILGKPVVELSADFRKKKKSNGAGWLEYDGIANTLIIPKNLKRIRCRLAGRGINKVLVSPENTNLIFDNYAWYEEQGTVLGGTWPHSTFGIHEYIVRDGALRACQEIESSFDLVKLVFPNSFVEVHEKFLRRNSIRKIFANSSSCMKAYAEKIGAEFIALDEQKVIISDDGLTLISYPQTLTDKEYTVPAGVRMIKEYAFKNNEYLGKIVMPDTVESIGEGAFLNCIALEKATLPNKVSELPNMLFAGCRKLSSVDWPKEITRIGEKAFYGTALGNVSIPEGVIEIGSNAFAPEYHGNNICTIELPKSVQKIGKSICAGIKEITLYDSIESDEKSAGENGEGSDSMKSELGGIGNKGLLEIYNHTIVVKSAVDGSVKYKILMYGREEKSKVFCAMISSWRRNAEFDFTTIDKCFPELKDSENRKQTVLNRLAYPIDLSDEAKEKYVSWLKRNSVSFLSELIEKDDFAGLMNYEQYGIITKTNVQELIDVATNGKNAEIIAYLLEYSRKL